MNENRMKSGRTRKPSSLKTLGALVITTLITPSNTLHASKPGLLERYRGSHHEKALDEQIKAYRPYALKNARTFGHGHGRTDGIFSISISNGAFRLKQRDSLKKSVAPGYPSRRNSQIHSELGRGSPSRENRPFRPNRI